MSSSRSVRQRGYLFQRRRHLPALLQCPYYLRRTLLASSARGGVQGADPLAHRRHHEHWRALWWSNHRSHVPEGIRGRHSLDPPRYRGRGVDGRAEALDRERTLWNCSSQYRRVGSHLFQIVPLKAKAHPSRMRLFHALEVLTRYFPRPARSKLLDHLLIEFGDIVGISAGYEPLIHNNLFVHPVRPGVSQVGLQ